MMIRETQIRKEINMSTNISAEVVFGGEREGEKLFRIQLNAGALKKLRDNQKATLLSQTKDSMVQHDMANFVTQLEQALGIKIRLPFKKHSRAQVRDY